MGLMVGRGWSMVGWGMVDNSMVDWGMVDSMMDRGMDGMMNSMVNWGMDSMMNRGSMMDRVSTKCCEWNSRAASHKRDKSNQSKDLKENC
jgi:hypothetical protein